jgi:cytoskeletal protein CcmA (bactofilin family)
MSIFRRDSAASNRPSASPPGSGGAPGAPAGAADAGLRPRSTQIAPGTRIKGEVGGPTDVLIEGEVDGAVKVEGAVVVGAEGAVKGPVSGRVVRVAGKVVGNVRGSERVEVGPAAILEGDIFAPRVVIAEGAFFKGKIEMLGEKSKPGRAAAEPKPETKTEAKAEKREP